MMDRINEEYLIDFVESITRRDGKMYLCPLCGSGTGAHHTGAFSVYRGRNGKMRWHCLACDRSGGIVGLAYEYYHCSTMAEATQRIQDMYGRDQIARPARNENEPKKTMAVKPEIRPTGNFKEQLDEWAAALPGSPGEAYLTARGISAETMRRCHIGYDARHYNAALGKTTECVIFPYDRRGSYYVARAIAEKGYSKPSGGYEEPLFNGAALALPGIVFIVESQICAISIIQAGAQAVALGGAGGNKLINAIREHCPPGVLVLCLDGDEPGRRASDALGAALAETDARYVDLSRTILCERKDPNEVLQYDGAEALAQRIEAVHTMINNTELE